MKEVIKNKEQKERQKYVPASVEVINVTAQRAILSASNDQYNTPPAEMEGQNVF